MTRNFHRFFHKFPLQRCTFYQLSQFYCAIKIYPALPHYFFIYKSLHLSFGNSRFLKIIFSHFLSNVFFLFKALFLFKIQFKNTFLKTFILLFSAYTKLLHIFGYHRQFRSHFPTFTLTAFYLVKSELRCHIFWKKVKDGEEFFKIRLSSFKFHFGALLIPTWCFYEEFMDSFKMEYEWLHKKSRERAVHGAFQRTDRYLTLSAFSSSVLDSIQLSPSSFPLALV